MLVKGAPDSSGVCHRGMAVMNIYDIINVVKILSNAVLSLVMMSNALINNE